MIVIVTIKKCDAHTKETTVNHCGSGYTINLYTYILIG